jgi:rubrerythrin
LESEIEAVKQIYSANPSAVNSWLTNLQQNFSALRNGIDEQFKCLVEQLENGMDQKHQGTIEELREQMQANYDDLFEELEKRMHQKHGHLLIEEAEKRMDQKYKGLIEQLEKRMDEKLKGLILMKGANYFGDGFKWFCREISFSLVLEHTYRNALIDIYSLSWFDQNSK